MLTVDEALEAVLRRAEPLPAVDRRLIRSLGATLARDVVADIDLPPFDKALMDGYAVRSVDLPDPGEHRLRIVEEVTAGRMPTRAISRGETSRIMTGAPLPSGADAVVMVERARAIDDDHVGLPGPVEPGLNRLGRGREMKAGDLLLAKGTRIDAAKLGLIASAGLDAIAVVPMPRVVVVPTGDELVPRARRPEAGQIRNTNSVMLAGMARAWGARSSEAPIAPDDPRGLLEALDAGLDDGRTDVLLISGGVSAGTRDLVPSALVELGIEPVFHKVRVKPGKPLWFGVGPRRGPRPGTLVFGLPGNPVSGLVGFLLFVRPALEALAGRPTKRTQLGSFCLGAPFEHRGDRPTFHPSKVVEGRVLPMSWAGSADLRTVATADGFVLFEAGDRSYREGEEVRFLPLGG